MTAVDVRVTHDWRLVAPWWHWPVRKGLDSQAQAAAGEQARSSAPVLQKYDSPDFVNTFLRDPQHRLAFRQDTDQVFDVHPGPKLGSLPTRQPTGRRKLYLDIHHRQYLVVTSLHCAAPGFPSADRAAVCEAGFVVRRYNTRLEFDQRKAGAKLLARLAGTRRRREGAEAQLAAAVQAGGAGAVRLAALQARVRSLKKIEDEALDAVRAWARESGVRRELQGWVPQGLSADGKVVPLPACPAHSAAGNSAAGNSAAGNSAAGNSAGGNSAAGQPAATARPTPLSGVGDWQPVTEVPELVEEATFPLYPLVADPTKPGHDATAETVWFGVVPTGSSDVDPKGAARFDDGSVYEIRCFVRRHRPECPRDGAQCSCPVTWSERTETYQLAAHTDLEGTANRPVTVQMPSLRQLQADAIRLGPGGTGGVRFRYPPGSALSFRTSNLDAENKNSPNPDFQVCSFAIPLITIVALFVFQLFLPIVVFVFQLWFLLALRFCIPPDVSIGAGALANAFAELGDGLNIKADVAARLGPGGDLESDLNDALSKDAKKTKAAFLADNKDKNGGTLFDRIKGQLTSGDLETSFYAALARSALAQGPRRPPDQVAAGKESVFAPRVHRDEVVAP